MSIAKTLLKFQRDASQCDRLIANAHRVDKFGKSFLTEKDRRQIIIASFLNFFIAWESFLEDCLAKYMTGSKTIAGKSPVRFVSPKTVGAAKKLTIGTSRYFDYANHENFKKVVSLYFDKGYPFEPIFSSSTSDLSDMRIMRNASAHISSTTQTSLDSLAQRIFMVPQPGIGLSKMLMMARPGAPIGTTVFYEYKNKLLTMAALIANG